MRRHDSTSKLSMTLIFLVIMGWHVLGQDRTEKTDPPASKKTQDAETEREKSRRRFLMDERNRINPDDPPIAKMHKNMMRWGMMNEKDRILYEYSKPGRFAGSYNSREVKENEDFLLTPALLVQESLAEDIVPTYPRE